MASAKLAAEPNISSLITNNLFEPYGIVASSNGDFYISDSGNNRIVKYRAESGTLANLAGYKSPEGGYADAKGILARFNQPTGVVLARNGLVVADTRNQVLRFVDVNTGMVSLLAGKLQKIGGIDGSADTATFNYPLGLAVDSKGNIYIADSKNNAIRVLNTANQVSTLLKSSYLNNVGQPGLMEPSSIAFDSMGQMYVANTRQNNILNIFTNELSVVSAKIFAGSFDGLGGTNDWYFATEGLMSQPIGLIWDDGLGLIVTDAGNHTIRRIYFNEEVGDYSMETFAGVPGSSGSADGGVGIGRFNKPMGIARDPSGALLVVDAQNNSIRRIQLSVPQGPVAKPRIGIVVETKDAFGEVVTKLSVVEDATFFNDQIIAVVDGEQGSDVRYTWAYAAGQLDDSTPPNPKLTDDVPKAYTDGQKEMPNQLMTLLADFTIKARSFKDGRQASDVARAHFRFKVAPPEVVGANPASFSLYSVTANAEMWYSVDGLDPTNRPPSIKYNEGTPIRMILKDQPRTIKARAFKSGYTPSSVSSKTFVPGDFTPNRISFGFEPPPSSLLTGEDIQTSLGFLVKELLDPANAVSLYLTPHFSLNTIDAMAAYDANPSPDAAVLAQTNLVWELNNIIQTNASFYDLQRFAGVDLSDETTELLQLNPQGSSLVRLNRLLLEDTYSEIIKSPPPDSRLEATSEFKGTAGRRFYAPVTLSLVAQQKIYTLQFNVSVTNVGYAAPVAQPVAFHSMLLEKVEDYFRTIQPMMYNAEFPPNGPFQDLLFTNQSVVDHNILIGVGWLERNGATNLYNTKKQDLITYSMAHDRLYDGAQGKVIVGAYAFMVPSDATNGQRFPIEIGRVSATEDGVSSEAYIAMPKEDTRTSLTAKTNVVVDSQPYLVGDAAPFHWLNTGDFGDHYLLNNDVVQVFQSAVYGLNMPPKDSDFYDAMDSCCDIPTPIYDGADYSIDSIHFGDGSLDVSDVFVTFRRSLDPRLKWFERYYVNGSQKYRESPNRFPNRALIPSEFEVKTQNSVPSAMAAGVGGEPSFVLVEADDVVIGETVAKAGSAIDIPIRAKVKGSYPVRVLMEGITVEALEDSPPLAGPVEFTPSPALGIPAIVRSSGAANYSAAWLDPKADGIIGDGMVGTLHVVLPDRYSSTAAYRIHFNHVSSSPNGLVKFPQSIKDGMLTAVNRSASSWGDGIPDSWRLRYFGTTSNVLADAMADADGDGVPNWAEYKAGTNPADVRSSLKLAANRSHSTAASQGVTLTWPSVQGRKYVVEYTVSFGQQQWVTLAEGIQGTGAIVSYTDVQPLAGPQFYRVRIQE
jgi:hypothetical protein